MGKDARLNPPCHRGDRIIYERRGRRIRKKGNTPKTGNRGHLMQGTVKRTGARRGTL